MTRVFRRACFPGWTLVLCLAGLGCAGSNDADVLGSVPDALEGQWDYLVTNAYDATFTGCTGDAAVFEDLTFYEANRSGAICTVAGSFAVVQDADAFSVVPHDVTCSDGSAATITGGGTITGGALNGAWESTSNTGVHAVLAFSGTVVGTRLEIVDGRRTFSGTFQGTCDMAPGLSATVTIQ